MTQIYKKTGNLRAVQLLLGHTKMDSTVRYLGVELEDALAMSEAIERPTGAAGIVVCEREITGSEIPTRDDVEDRLMDTQLAQASRRHLRDLRRKASISVRG